jgi:glycosyltransferase involved in cell wall biosynthesis
MAKIIIWLEHGASLYFNAVFVTQPQVVKRLDGRATLLRNAPLTCGAVIERARVLSSDIDKGKFARLIYAGVIDESRGLSNMVEALPAINGLMAARLWLMGRICDHDLGTAESLEGWRYVDYVGMVPQSVAYAYMAKADVGLILLDDVADYSQTSPNKLYEYMFWKVPFVATGFESWRRQLGEVKAGIFIEKAQESACTEAVLTLLSSPSTAEAMGENGHRYICSEFSWEKEADVFLQKIDEVLDSNQIG